MRQWYDGCVVWAMTAVVVLAVGLPLAAWQLSRDLEIRRPPQAGGLGPPAGQADRLLIERHRLPAVQRYQVQQAVVYGRALSDPALRAAARDLAAAALDGQITIGRGVRLGAWVLLIEAAVMIAAGVFILVSPGSPAGVIPVLPGAWSTVQGAIVLRLVRGSAERAIRLNA